MEWRFVLLLFALLFLVHSEGTPVIPSLPNYFSVYTESITSADSSDESSVYLSKEYYNVDLGLTLTDLPAESLDQSYGGTLSSIQDINVGVIYFIYRRYSNCTVIPLYSTDETLSSYLFLLSALDYEYAGNISAHGIVLDNWRFTGNFTHGGFNYTDTTLLWSITRSGQAVSSLSSITTSATPWRLSVQGSQMTSDDLLTNVSFVSRYFDLSFEEPSYDIFDVSLCIEPEDAVKLTLAVPGKKDELYLNTFRENVRKSVSNYTQIYPVQVGNIEIIDDNGTFTFTTLQILNLTTLSNVTDAKTARRAYEMILEHTADNGSAPFQIELASGVMVTPYIVNADQTQNCTDISTTTVTSTVYITVSPTPSSSPSPSPSSVCPTPSPSIAITTTTTTETVSPTTMSCSYPIPSATPTSPATTCPPSMAGLSQTHVVGLAFGTLLTGVLFTCVSMVIFFICYQKKRTKMWSPSTTGYQKQPDTMLEREYFQ